MLSKNVISKIVNAIRSRLDRSKIVADIVADEPITVPVAPRQSPVIVLPWAGLSSALSLPDLMEAAPAPVLSHDDVLSILRERQAVCWFVDLVPGTWLHEALNRLNMAGGRVMLDRHVGGVEDVQTFLIRYAIVLPTTRSEDWATWETLWNGPHLLDMLDALRRMVEWEIGTGVRGEGGRAVLDEIDGLAAALTSLDAQRFGLVGYMRLRWDEIVVRHRKADAFLDHAVNHVGATSELCEHGVLTEFLEAQARAFGLIDDADDGGYGLTALGYRYVFERVLRLPSVLLPAMTAREVDDGMGSRLVFETPGSLPFGDRHSLAVALEDGGETIRRPLTEAFQFADPADAERFAEMVGEGVR